MINFIKYIIRYWTHYRPIEIKKNTAMFKNDEWHYVSCWVRKTNSDLQLDNIQINCNIQK
jgi:hypothetical protein